MVVAEIYLNSSKSAFCVLFSQDCDQLWLMKGTLSVSGDYLGPAQWMKFRDSFQVSIPKLYFRRQKDPLSEFKQSVYLTLTQVAKL